MLRDRNKSRVPGPPPELEGAASRFTDTDIVDVEAKEPLAPVSVSEDSVKPPQAAVSDNAAKAAGARAAKGLFKRNARPVAPEKNKAAKRPKPSAQAAPPIQLILGYLPEVTARDAMEYALGMADKHLIQPGLGYVGVFAFSDGFVYELQEGGTGRAFTPAILQYFNSHGPWTAGEAHRVVIQTAARKLEVVRNRAGLESALLPESSEDAVSEIEVTDKLTSLVPRREGLFWTGSVVFLTGLAMAAATGTYFRLQGYAAPPKQSVEPVSAMVLPHMQYSKLEQAYLSGKAVGALKYENKAWTVVSPATAATTTPDVPKQGAPE